MTDALTAHVAAFATSCDVAALPDEVIETGRKSILDGLGLAVAGAATECGRIVQTYLGEFGGNNATCRRARHRPARAGAVRRLRERHRHPRA